MTHKKLVSITLPKNAQTDMLTKIKNIIIQFPGDIPVKLVIPQNGSYHEIHIKTKITPSPACIDLLRALVGESNVQNP